MRLASDLHGFAEAAKACLAASFDIAHMDVLQGPSVAGLLTACGPARCCSMYKYKSGRDRCRHEAAPPDGVQQVVMLASLH